MLNMPIIRPGVDDRDTLAESERALSEHEAKENELLHSGRFCNIMPSASGLPHNEKTCFIEGDGKFQYDLPDDCKHVIAVSYPIDEEITSLMLNEEDYEVNGNKLLITSQRPQPGEQIQVTYRR